MRRRNTSLLTELGPGGLSSLALAFLTGILGLGLPVLWRLRRVIGGTEGDPPVASDVVLVLGRELTNDRPTAVFAARLTHAAELMRAGWAPRILISGGMTGRAAASEAAAGRDYLVGLGVDGTKILIEERSRHTLENLFFVRETLKGEGLRQVLLVSDPLHLARAATLARGLGIEVRCSPSRIAPPLLGSAIWWWRALSEAFLLHWYHVGLGYSRALGLRRALARVT